MDGIDNEGASYAYIEHTTEVDQERVTDEARKLLMSDDVAPIPGDFSAALEKARKASPATPNSGSVAAAEAAVEEARAIIGATPAIKSLAPIDVESPAETIAPYAEFKKDSITESVGEYAIRVKEYEDEHGRQFYEFDNGRSKPLLACLFTTTAGQLISLNGVVSPLASFQSIIYARTAPAKVGKEAKRTASRTGGDLRSAIPVGDDKVLCTLTDGQSLTIPNTTVQHVMMALQRLAPPVLRIETEHESPEAEHVGPLRRLWRWLY